MEQPEFYYDEFGFRVDKEGTIESLVCNLAGDLGETPAAVTLIMKLWPLGSGRFCMRATLLITIDPEQCGFDCGFTYSDVFHLPLPFS